MGRSASRPLTASLALACLGSVSAYAHHSLALYNREVSLTIEGVVKSYEFANPHVKLYLAVTNPDGSSTDWFFESGSVSRLVSRGFNRVSARRGERLTVHYNPRRNGAAGGYFLEFTTEDGRTYGPTNSRE